SGADRKATNRHSAGRRIPRATAIRHWRASACRARRNSAHRPGISARARQSPGRTRYRFAGGNPPVDADPARAVSWRRRRFRRPAHRGGSARTWAFIAEVMSGEGWKTKPARSDRVLRYNRRARRFYPGGTDGHRRTRKKYTPVAEHGMAADRRRADFGRHAL